MVRLAVSALIVTLVSVSVPLSTLKTGQSMILPVVGSSVKVIVLNETFSPSTVKMADVPEMFETVFSAESAPVMESVLDVLLNVEATVSVGCNDDPIRVRTENVLRKEYAYWIVRHGRACQPHVATSAPEAERYKGAEDG